MLESAHGIDAASVFAILLFMMAVVLVALVVTAKQNRRHEAQTRPRLCRSCALSHPPFANYCCRCGRML